MKTPRSKQMIMLALLNGVLIATAAYALFEVQRVRTIVAGQETIDTHIASGLTEMVEAESEQFGQAQTILVLYDRNDNSARKQRQDATNQIQQLVNRIDQLSTHIAHVAHELPNDDSYDLMLKNLTQAVTANEHFAENILTLQRLSSEGRAAEAARLESELHSQNTHARPRLVNELELFAANARERLIEHHARENAAIWLLFGVVAATLAMWMLYFKHRWRQSRIELARSQATKAPRAEHLKKVRSQAEPNAARKDTHRKKPLAGCRVLAAEDGPHNQRFIQRVLIKAGAEVVIAENGDDAIKLVFAATKADNPFDVVLMDIEMPVMGGLEATMTLRRFQYHGPIVAVSAQIQSSDIDTCLEAGCDAYLAKPINHSELESVVTHFFSKPPVVTEPLAAE